jgi:hypothetical protein
MPPSGEGHHFTAIKSVVMVGVRELFDVSFGHIKRRKKTGIVTRFKGLS